VSVAATTELANGLFVPFMQRTRGGDSHGSPVGTVTLDATDTGDGSGGTATVSVSIRRTMFGFRTLVIPTSIVTFDNLAAVEPIRLEFQFAGLRRLVAVHQFVRTSVRHNATNMSELGDLGIVLESNLEAATDALAVQWETNTNSVVYHVHLYGVVYDLEILEKYGTLDPLMAGVR